MQLARLLQQLDNLRCLHTQSYCYSGSVAKYWCWGVAVIRLRQPSLAGWHWALDPCAHEILAVAAVPCYAEQLSSSCWYYK